MITIAVSFALLWIVCTAEDFFYSPYNVSRSTPSGIAAYRSALTLDWLAAEDSRQRELVAAFETEPDLSAKTMPTDCIAYPRPSTGKVARLMLELLKNLEGDEGVLIPDLIQALIRSKLLVLETSIFDAEPDFEALVKTPGVMMGEPHKTFPRILAMIWMTITDPSSKKHGWCAINKVTKYLSLTKPSDTAKTMRALDQVLSRARFIMEEFIQHVTPLNMLKTSPEPEKKTMLKTKPDFAQVYGVVKNPKKNRPATRTDTSDDVPPQIPVDMPVLNSEHINNEVQHHHRQNVRIDQQQMAEAGPPILPTKATPTPFLGDMFADDVALLSASSMPRLSWVVLIVLLIL